MKPSKSKSKDKKIEKPKADKKQGAKKSLKKIENIRRNSRFNPDSDEYWET
jgi:hypothetical protein